MSFWLCCRVDPQQKAKLRKELREMCETLPTLPDGQAFSPKPGADDAPR